MQALEYLAIYLTNAVSNFRLLKGVGFDLPSCSIKVKERSLMSLTKSS